TRLGRVGAALVVAEHARVVHQERVVRAGLDPGHPAAPAVDVELVVVPAAVATDGTTNLGHAGGGDASGQLVERRRVEGWEPIEVAPRVPVARQQRISPADEVHVTV